MPSVTLKSGTVVNVDGVLFNKEQKINVTKTYVTTVKKAVTKVSGDFFKVDVKLMDTSLFHDLGTDNIDVKKEEPVEVTMPELTIPEPVAEEKVEEKATGELEIPAELAVDDQPTMVIPVPEPVKVEAEETVMSPETPVEEKPAEEPKEEAIPADAFVPFTVTPQGEAPAAVEPEKVEEVKVETPEPEVKPVVETEPALTFDGSNESNLNKALGEVSEEKVVAAPQEGVESLREFGVDQPAMVVTPEETPAEVQAAPVASRGFANNKFFMAIAILFFIASCVFLGYEAFQYFQLR